VLTIYKDKLNKKWFTSCQIENDKNTAYNYMFDNNEAKCVICVVENAFFNANGKTGIGSNVNLC